MTKGNSPFGPYNVYFASADYNPAEPNSPSLLNDFAKIATSRDAFLMFWDEFPLLVPGFNGAQEFAFNKNALETRPSPPRISTSPSPSRTWVCSRRPTARAPAPAGPPAGTR